MSLAAAIAKAGFNHAGNQEVTSFISCGYPPLDKIVSGKYKGGGFPVGRIVEIFGDASCGKTAIVTRVAAEAQSMGGYAIYKEHEQGFDVGQGINLGLSDDPNQWNYDRPDTFEKSVQDAVDLMLFLRGMEMKEGSFVTTSSPPLPMDKPIVVIFDSLASMVPQSAAKRAGDRNMNDNTALARATSAHFPLIAKVAERTNTLVFFLNQSRTKIGVMYGDPTTTPGGKAPEFYASVRLKLGRSMLTNEKKDKIGQAIGCEAIKNKVNRPWLKTTWDFMFNPDGTGSFDIIGGTIEEAVRVGLIERSGAWTTWDGKKWNSKKALIEHIEANGQFEQIVDLLATLDSTVS